MREKHLFKLTALLIAVLMGLAMVVSCSKDDDDGGQSSSQGQTQKDSDSPGEGYTKVN